MPKPKITISYRRSDTKQIAGRISQELTEHFGKGVVFIDFDHIPFGVDFRERIKSQVASSDILLAIIGPNWRAEDKSSSWWRRSNARIDNESDFVRTEIATALNANIQIIPILIDTTQTPSTRDLPKEIEPLSFLNAARIDSGVNFRNDIKRLIRDLNKHLRLKIKKTEKPKPKFIDKPSKSPKATNGSKSREAGVKPAKLSSEAPRQAQIAVPAPSRVHHKPSEHKHGEDVHVRIALRSSNGDTKEIDCKVDLDALRDLIAHHKVRGTQDECVRALRPKIESIAGKVYIKRGLEKNGGLSIHPNDLVLYGFG
jgi:hypothetical protein